MSNKDKNSDVILGIDLGTTNSLVSVYKETAPELIINRRGLRMTPSVVSLKNKDEILVGELARNQTVMNWEMTVATIKRKMGTGEAFKLGKREFTAVELSGIILRKLKQDAEAFLGHEVEQAVITVPAFFNDNQRLATKRAGELAGLTVLKLLNEPTAAALAYGYARGGEGNLMVVDLGGGTLDITLLEYQDNLFKVRGTGGSTQLGGVDFDRILVQWLADRFKKANGVDLLADPIGHQQLLIQCEKLKIDLSTVTETKITIPYISVTEKGPLHLNESVTREIFEQLIEDQIETMQRLINETFVNSSIPKEWVQSVILVGGATRVPLVEKTIRRILPEEVVFKRDLNPDEVVALGAGVLAGILTGDIKDMEFLDITSHNLGVENHKKEFIKLIPSGTPYPCEKTKLFSTTKEKQTEVTIHVLQNGEKQGDEGTVSLGVFHLKKVQPLPAGEPNIDVTFSIDKHGLMNVSAVDLDSGETEEIFITENIVSNAPKSTERRGTQLTIV